MLPETEFAIVDVETTGLFPRMGDRIVEIAAIRATAKGEVLHEYATLVNPNRDVGPTHIHGISAQHLAMPRLSATLLATSCH